MRSRRLLGLIQLLDELVAERRGVHAPRPAGQDHLQVVSHLYLEVAPVEVHGNRALAALQDVGHGGAARAGARGHRLADAALEDPGCDRARAVRAPERDVGAVREQLAVLDRRPELGEVEPLEAVVDLDGALEIADRHVLELQLPADDRHRPGPVGATRREVPGGKTSPPHVDPARVGYGYRGPYLPRGGLDRERVSVGPAVSAQVHDRLARAVARQLGLAAVRVEDAQARDEAALRRLVEQQHAVGADAHVRLAEAADAGGGQLERQVTPLDDDVVVADRLPFLELESCRGQAAGHITAGRAT